ncbi:MAG: hypothetical protein H0Z33_08890 [Bacillaceae bacterium]|nr:hypothetical protein [Bacillaceae bacterium]
MQARPITTRDGIYWLYDRKCLDAEHELLQKLQTIVHRFEQREFILIVDLCAIRLLLPEDRAFIVKVSVYCKTHGMNKQIYVVNTWQMNKMRIHARLHNMPFYESIYPKNPDMEKIKEEMHVLN